MYEYRAKVKRVVDGDTADFSVELGFGVSIDIRVRLKGVNTPEIHGVKKSSAEYQKGLDSWYFVIAKLHGSQDGKPLPVTLRTHKDSKGKYGRWLADVYVADEATGVEASLADILVEAGKAERVEY